MRYHYRNLFRSTFFGRERLNIKYLIILAAALLCSSVGMAAPAKPTCIVPSEPDGGFQLTCELARDAIAATDALPQPLAIERMPGGVGAIAFNVFTSTRRAGPGSLVAFSEGSLFNLARGKFGSHDWTEVRWLAVLGVDYGAVAVQDQAPWRTLPDLVKSIRDAPRSIAIGGSGTINGRDWMRAASLAELAGVDIRTMRFVAFEGGGDCMAALVGGHVQVCMNDAATTQTRIDRGQPVRLLAVYAKNRIEGELSSVPTAREQGFDIVWPVVRGVYMGPDVSDADYAFWADAFQKAMAQPAYQNLLTSNHLQPYPLVGDELMKFVHEHAVSVAKEREPL
ncbi:Bug family tripartite tricarboxylate transporter substrate binding protein [Rhizobium metallidurans]|uniref:Putative tricarboxylic transport membrane protein n=1 Tax=Rhizobium metallidurans TaxID=1265931 RepID=A0A7W6D2K1_9HYPH|nr:tripartite tricarboxylate transporter substrate-binding protein [Rhizobium metallidurans]MBB3967011.1 putative tricarboxylic transport membrane protein [Rhizobium metallidurans]